MVTIVKTWPIFRATIGTLIAIGHGLVLIQQRTLIIRWDGNALGVTKYMHRQFLSVIVRLQMNYNRRQQGLKKARKLLKIYRALGSLGQDDALYDDDSPLAHLYLKTRVPCSCPMCGNPRRHFGKKTIQELRNEPLF